MTKNAFQLQPTYRRDEYSNSCGVS